MSEKTSCAFCNIIAGTSPAYKVYENESTLCILDIHPWTQGQCLVMPKRHVPWWHELTVEETHAVFETARTVANRLMKVFSPDFVYVYARGRRIPHTHIFLVPTFKEDVLDRFFHALEKVQESPPYLAQLAGKERMLETVKLLRQDERP